MGRGVESYPRGHEEQEDRDDRPDRLATLPPYHHQLELRLTLQRDCSRILLPTLELRLELLDGGEAALSMRGCLMTFCATSRFIT